MLKKLPILSVLLVLLASTTMASVEPQPRKFLYEKKAFSSLINVEVYTFDVHPPVMEIKLWSDLPENVWWKARVQIHMYFCGATGHYEGVRPFRFWVPEWGWGWRTYEAEIAPGETFGTIVWNIQDGELFDGHFTVLSWLPE